MPGPLAQHFAEFAEMSPEQRRARLSELAALVNQRIKAVDGGHDEDEEEKPVTTAVDELEHLDDAEVYRQLHAARRAMSQDLLRDPVTLARGLDRRFRMRPIFQVIGEALAEVGRGDVDRLLILTPPQVGKSTTVAEWFPYWWLCLYPVDKVAVTSYGDGLALRRGKKIRSYVEEYGDEWELHLKGGSGAMQDWEVTAGGGVRSVSVGRA